MSKSMFSFRNNSFRWIWFAGFAVTVFALIGFGYGQAPIQKAPDQKDTLMEFRAARYDQAKLNMPTALPVEKIIATGATPIHQFALPETYFGDITFRGTDMHQALIWDGEIYNLDPATGATLSVLTVDPDFILALTWDGTSFWGASFPNDTKYPGAYIFEIDPSTGLTLSTFLSPDDFPSGLGWDGSYLWVADDAFDALYQVDSTGSLQSSFPTLAGFNIGAVFAQGLIWTGNNIEWTIDGYDPATGDLRKRIVPPAHSPRLDMIQGLGFDGQYLWAAISDIPNLQTIDYQFGLPCISDGECDDSNGCTDDFCTGGTENTEAISDANDAYGGSDETMVNIFDVTTDVIMTDYGLDIFPDSDIDVTLVVYESDSLLGVYDLIYTDTRQVLGYSTGYTFDNLEVPLLAGKHYAIGFYWAGSYVSIDAGWTTNSDPFSFGTKVGTQLFDGTYPSSFTASGLPDNEGLVGTITTVTVGTCDHTNNSDSCDDGLWCNGADTCLDGGCNSHAGRTCGDGVDCTVDTCDERNDQCVHTTNDAYCDDEQWCNGRETCDVTNDCQLGSPPTCVDAVACTDDSCDEVNDICVNAPNDSLCDDGAWCNGAETCHSSLGCQAGTPVTCFDQVPCTNDVCDEVNDQCVFTPDDSNCDDGDWCNGAETCDAQLDCQAGTAPDCDDSVDCTVDTCDETNDQCDNAPDNTQCDDQVGCTDNVCDPVYGCEYNANDANCDDGTWCNGDETCDAVYDCQTGTAPDCDDGVDCTDDSCDEVNDQCANAPDDSVCDDGVDCTTDFCDPATGCDSTPDDTYCSDNVFCNGQETCNPEKDCQPGTAVECPDDGEFCNGTEFCDEDADDCGSTGDPCESDEACNEESDICDLVVDDDDDDDDDDTFGGSLEQDEVELLGGGACEF